MKVLVLLAALAAAAAVVVAGSPAASSRPAAGDLSGFSGDLPAGTHLVVREIAREQAQPTNARLRAVPCAAGAARGATCWIPRS